MYNEKCIINVNVSTPRIMIFDKIQFLLKYFSDIILYKVSIARTKILTQSLPNDNNKSINTQLSVCFETFVCVS